MTVDQNKLECLFLADLKYATDAEAYPGMAVTFMFITPCHTPKYFIILNYFFSDKPFSLLPSRTISDYEKSVIAQASGAGWVKHLWP